MDLFKKIKGAADTTTQVAGQAIVTVEDTTKRASKAVSKLVDKAALAAGEAVACEVTAKIIDVAVDTAAGVVFDPVDNIVNRFGIAAKILPSERMRAAHEITSDVVNGAHEIITGTAKDSIKKALNISGKKLIEVGKPKD